MPYFLIVLGETALFMFFAVGLPACLYMLHMSIRRQRKRRRQSLDARYIEYKALMLERRI